MNPKIPDVGILYSLEEISFFTIAAIAVMAWLLTRLIDRLLPWVTARMPIRLRLGVLPFVPVLRLGIILSAALLIVAQVVRPEIQNLVAILGAAGLAIGFAFKDYASSLIAGVVTVSERPFQPGDWVEIDGIYGEVQSLGLRGVVLVTPDDTRVVIPHLKIWDHSVQNANAGARDLLCVTDFYLRSAHDTPEVRRKLFDVAVTSRFVQLRRPIAVTAKEETWATHFRVKAYPINARDQFRFTTDITVRGNSVLARMGVELARDSLTVAEVVRHPAQTALLTNRTHSSPTEDSGKDS